MKVAGVALAALLGLVAACSSSGGGSPTSYKTITCAGYTAKWSATDSLTNGALDIANAFMDSTPIDPKNGAQDAADFGDQIAAACDTATGDTRIIQLKGRILAVFLAKHPEDQP